MRVRRFAMLVGLLGPAAAWATAGLPRQDSSQALLSPSIEPEGADAGRILTLQTALRALLRSRPLERMRVGVAVLSAPTGQLLFASNPDRMFDPASNEKILTTVTALANLGPEYRYHTSVLGPLPDEQGQIAGDLFLRGSGDPSLRTEDMAELGRKLSERGVRQVRGAIVVEERSRPMPGDHVEDAELLGDPTLTLNHNTFQIRIEPGLEPGEPPLVAIAPGTRFIRVINRATTTSKGRCKIDVNLTGPAQALSVTLSGRIPVNHAAMHLHRRPRYPAIFVAAVLVETLEALGIEVKGGVRVGRAVQDLQVLADHASRPLAVLIRSSNKDSNNFVAEQIFQTVGVERYGAPASTGKARRAITEYLERLGLRPGSFYPANGSGLAHTNRITPGALVTLLRRIYSNLGLAPDFIQSLAVGGVDGTIRKRFRGSDAAGFVRAKTGTLRGVSALSGYVGHKDSVLIFAIFVQGFRDRRLYDVRRAQVRMVQEMMRFVRKSEPQTEGVVQEMDVESSTDETNDLPQNPEPPPTPTPGAQ